MHRIGMELGLTQKLEQRLRLAPQIIQSIQILQLPALDLRELIQKEMEENPLVEVREEAPGDADNLPGEDAREQQQATAENEGRLDGEFSKLEDLQEYFDYQQTARRSYFRGDKDRKQEAMQNTAAKPISLQDYMLGQFKNLEPPERLAAIGHSIIYNIDDNGYLLYPLGEIIGVGSTGPQEELSTATGEDGREGEPGLQSFEPGPVDSEALREAEEALALVQQVEPPGVGARSLEECLLLQTGKGKGYKLERRLVREHLDDIMNNRIPRIAKATGRSVERVKEAVEFIKGLNPHPGAVISGEPAPVVVPDIVVKNVEGRYEIQLENTYVPDIYINPTYRKLLQQKGNDPKVREYVRMKLEAARRLQEAIEQRKNTLYRIAKEVIEIQEGFLEHGITHFKPLKMQDIADRIGVHVSTVSRAIANKFIQTHRGVFAMKFFFTGSPRTREDFSTRTLKQQLADMIVKEDPRHPLSDAEIVEEFKRNGFEIARRTITKYRKVMRIPSSRRRRQY